MELPDSERELFRPGKFELQHVAEACIEQISTVASAVAENRIQASDYTMVQSTRVFPQAVADTCIQFKGNASKAFAQKLDTIISQVTNTPFDGECRIIGEVENETTSTGM